jgi:hypothetical protein
VLADGHHRFETALTYREERRALGTADAGADSIMCFVVELADDQLSIEPIHRLLHLPGGAPAAGTTLREVLGAAFTVTAAGPNTAAGVDALESAMAASGALGLADQDGLALLVPRREITDPALASEPAPVAGTDAALVEAVVVPLLTGASIEYRHDARTVAALVASGVADAALLLRPVSVADTRAAATAGLRMPQKTTFFAPKPRTGMVFRSLD